jgi:hypothetical protein
MTIHYISPKFDPALIQRLLLCPLAPHSVSPSRAAAFVPVHRAAVLPEPGRGDLEQDPERWDGLA